MALALMLVLVLATSYAGSVARQLPHMFCQFGVAYCLPFHRFFAELGRVLGGVGLSGIVGTSGNGMAAEASAYPLLEGTRTRTSMGK